MESAMTERTVELSVECPACSEVNRLKLDRLVDHEKVSCSRCGSELGVVGDLIAANEQTARDRVASELSASDT